MTSKATEFKLQAQDAPESAAWINREVGEDATMVLEVRKSVWSRRDALALAGFVTRQARELRSRKPLTEKLGA